MVEPRPSSALICRLHPMYFKLPAAFSNAKTHWLERHTVLISLEDSNGYLGMGEVAPLPGFSHESLEQAQAWLVSLTEMQPSEDDLERILRGEGPLAQTLSGLPSARYGLELAFWELQAQRQGLALWRWLQPRLDRSPAMQTLESPACFVNALAEGLDPERVLDQASTAWARGVRVLKLKVGRPGRHHEEEKLLERLRARGPRGLRFRLDANGAYEPAQVRHRVQALAGPDVEGFEEPAPWWLLLQLPPLPVPVLLDESLATQPSPEQIQALLHAGRVVGGVLKPSCLGGLGACWRWAQLLRAHGGRCILTHTHEGPVGQLGAVALALALGGDESHGLDIDASISAWQDVLPRLKVPGWKGQHFQALELPGLGLHGLLATQAGPICRSVSMLGKGLFEGHTQRLATHDPHGLAIITDKKSITWQELSDTLLKRCRDIQQLHPSPDEALVMVAQPSVETLIWLLACLELGRLVLPLHPAWTESERLQALEGLPLVWRWLNAGETQTAPEAPDPTASSRMQQLVEACGGQKPAVMLFTSGTSGRPKGVVLTQTNLWAAAEASAQRLGWQRADRWLLALPLGHVGGLSVLLRCWLAGVPVVLAGEGKSLSAEVLWETLERFQISHLSLVPTQLHRLLSLERGKAPRSLRRVLVGGAATSERLMMQARACAWPVLTTYGMTETCAQLCTQVPEQVLHQQVREKPDELKAPPGVMGPEDLAEVDRRAELAGSSDVGTPLEGAAVKIVEGQVFVKGPTLAPVRWLPSQPFAWQQLAQADGFYPTGDLGRLTAQGTLQLSGRASELIISGGENIAPLEVEQLLEQHPSIKAACVFGLPDEQWGQQVVAVLVLQAPVEAQALERWLRARMAGFKRPRRFYVLESLPIIGVGKLDRRASAQQALEQGRLLF
ncbi:MAG: AMP-binding protein [Myxococcota bacterium]